MKRQSKAEQRRLRGIRLAYAFAAICAIGGLVGLPWALGYLMDALASESWPAVTGELNSAEVVTESRRGVNTLSETSYRPRVRYTYVVDGQRYEAERLRFDFDALYNERSEAREALAPFSSGGPVTVYYEPGDPTNAVLQPGSDWRTYRPLVFALAPLALGVFILIYRLRQDLRQPATAAEPARAAR